MSPRPLALVGEDPAEPTGQPDPAGLVLRGRFVGGIPSSGKTHALILAGLELDAPAGGEAA